MLFCFYILIFCNFGIIAKIMIRRFYHIRQEIKFFCFFELFRYPVRNILNYLFVNNRLRSSSGVLLPYESSVGFNGLSKIIQFKPPNVHDKLNQQQTIFSVFIFTRFILWNIISIVFWCLLICEVEVLPCTEWRHKY